MRRTAAVVIAMGAVIGLLDPYACRQYSMVAADVSSPPQGRMGEPISAKPMHKIPASAQAHLLDVANRALAMLPAPKGYVFNNDADAKAGDEAFWDPERSTFRTPGHALAERSYDPSTASTNPPPTLEQRVFVNCEVAIPMGLASVGGSPKAYNVPGAVAVEVTTITDSEDSEGKAPSDGGRVALPMTSAQKQTAITIIRVLLANPMTESLFRSGIAAGAMPAWTPPVPKKPGEIQTLVIELYGGKADVEAVAKRLRVAELRKLLD